jgi:hypothetical protein
MPQSLQANRKNDPQMNDSQGYQRSETKLSTGRSTGRSTGMSRMGQHGGTAGRGDAREEQQCALLQQLSRRKAALEEERRGYLAHWQDLSDVILPRRGRAMINSQLDTSRGAKKNQRIIDSTGTIAARICASGLMSGITSPARPWFRLSLPDPKLADYAPVKLWLDEVRKRMLRVMAKSNFYNAFATLYEELSVFGTAVNLILEDDSDVIRCYPLTAGDYLIAHDHRLTVDTLYRDFTMTVAGMVAKFGLENCSEQVQQRYRDGQLDEEHRVCHAIEPNDKRVIGFVDNGNMPYRSVYWEQGCDWALSISGFKERPFQAARWHLAGAETYGRSPGMDALPFVRQLQFEQKQKAQGIAKQVNPPMIANVQMKNQEMSVLPGGITYTPNNSSQAGFAPAYQVNIQLGELRADIEDIRNQINQAFFADLFLMISQLDDVRSATEIIERKQEKLLMLGPVLERLHDELLDPAIDRIFNIMLANGLLPEPPQELRGQALDIDYISTLAQAQKAAETGSIERIASFVGNLAGAKPEVIDKIDFDAAVDEYGDALGISPRIVLGSDQVQQTRAARAQAMQQQQAMMATQQAIQGAKTLSETKLGGDGSALDRVAGMLGGMKPGVGPGGVGQ